MKPAISATGKDLDSMIDPEFGRATYFLIVDVESGQNSGPSRGDRGIASGGRGKGGVR